jgi:outer membrane protein assembly factor BamD (BamD/ComL family)
MAGEVRGQRLALIIGNSLYLDDTLARLITPDVDVGALGELLLDQELGGFDDVNVLVNMSSHIIRRSISSFFSKKTRDDLLLLYFSGHGILDDQGLLYLAVRDTDSKLLRGTAISANFITDEMNNSHSQRQVLVLDCCHSGAFARGAKGQPGASVGTAAAFEGTGYGRVVLTASDATQYAWEGDHVLGKADNSVFTHYILQGIRSGEADANGDGQVTVDEIYDYVYKNVIKQTPNQTPGKWAYKERGEIVIAHTPSQPGEGRPKMSLPETDREVDEQLEKLYHEGLAAYWLEEWDKAVRCFQAIVEARPEYPDAANKLEMSRRKKRLRGLYDQALAAEAAQDWQLAIARLEELTSSEPGYQDASARLENAKRSRLLADLYAEATQLSQAQKWQAVVNVFAQIKQLKPDYPDPQNLLSTAQAQVAEQQRQKELARRYQRALKAMDEGRWKEATNTLDEILQVEAGYQDAERLLQRARDELNRQEKAQLQQTQIATLYQQALGLRDARQWRGALGKMEEIRALDLQFQDQEGVAARCREEIAEEEAETQRQNQLGEMYTAAARSLDDGQYQQALEQWSAIQALDPTYPDRQKVAKTARRKLQELSKVEPPRGKPTRWQTILLVVASLAVLGGLIYLGIRYGNKPPREVGYTPVPGMAVVPGNTQRPSPTVFYRVYDGFNNNAYDGSYNKRIWENEYCDDPKTGKVYQQDGNLFFTALGYDKASNLELIQADEYALISPIYAQARMKVSTDSKAGHLGLFLGFPEGNAECQIQAGESDGICCWTYFFGVNKSLPCQSIALGSWYAVRITISNLDPITFDYSIDGKDIGSITPASPEKISKRLDRLLVHMIAYDENLNHGYLDDMYFGLVK